MNGLVPFLKAHFLSGKLVKILDYYDEILSLPHRSEVLREHLKQDDLFLLLCFSELLGIPNPVSYYTLELYPYIIRNFHKWHLRLGMKHSPLESVRCC